jgi:hypothetical protein
MELPIVPESLFRYIPFLVNEYEYDFADDYKENCNIEMVYLYLNSLEEFQLKNIWNALVDKWGRVKILAKDDRGFKRSKFSKLEIERIHCTISPETLNKCLCEFIQNNVLLAIIAIQSIVAHGYPRSR